MKQEDFEFETTKKLFFEKYAKFWKEQCLEEQDVAPNLEPESDWGITEYKLKLCSPNEDRVTHLTT